MSKNRVGSGSAGLVLALVVGGGALAWLLTRDGGGDKAPGIEVAAGPAEEGRVVRPSLVGTPGSADGGGANRTRPAAGVPGSIAPGPAATTKDAPPDHEVREDRLVGRITDTTGRALAGAVVSLQRLVDGRPAPLPETFGPTDRQTDASGWFRYQGLPTGEYLLTARAPGRLVVVRRVTSGAAALDLALHEELALAGTLVLADDGTPVEGVMVTARSFDSPQAGAPAFAVTDALGLFRIGGLLEGDYLLRYEPGGEAAGKDLIAGRLGPVRSGTQDLVLRAERGQAIAGVVHDADGGPIPGGFTVLALRVGTPIGHDPTAQRLVSVAADGTFRLPGLPPGRYTLSVGPPAVVAGATAEHAVTVVQGIWAGTEDLVVTLVRGAPLRGRVVDQDGQGVVGSGAVYVYPVGQHAGVPGSVTLPLDDEGRFQTPHLDPAQPYTVLATGLAGYMAVKEEGIHAGAQEILLRTTRAQEIRGRVVDPDGKPVLAGVGVQAVAIGDFDRSTPGWMGVAYTQADGSFILGQLGAHEFHLVAGGGPAAFVAAAGPVKASPGATDVTLRVRRGRRVGGRLLDAAGQPLRTGNLSVWGTAGFGGLPHWIAVHDPEGRYLFPGVPAGPLRFGMNHEGAFVTLLQTPTDDGGIDLRVPE